MRTKITLVAICLYTVLFNLYIFERIHDFWDVHYIKLFYNYITLSAILFYIADTKLGFESETHEQLNFVCILAVIMNFINIILTEQGNLTKPVEMFWTFNGSIFVCSILVLYLGSIYGYFNKENNGTTG